MRYLLGIIITALLFSTPFFFTMILLHFNSGERISEHLVIFISLLLAAIFAAAYELTPSINSHKPKTEPDIIRWFNATHGILLGVNKRNIQIYTGVIINEENAKIERNSLEHWWGISNQDELLEQVEILMTYGPRDRYVAAWDYSRAMSLLSSGYLCGYLSRTAALNRSLEVAKFIQTQYHSWDEFTESYLRGYKRWSGQSSQQRQEIYNNLKAIPNSPYLLPWDLKLKRVW